MAARKSLRAVAPDEKPARKKKASTVAAAVADGSRRDELVAMRARIAKAIDDPEIRGADLAALSRRLLDIGKELESLDAAAQEVADAGEAREVDSTFDAEAL